MNIVGTKQVGGISALFTTASFHSVLLPEFFLSLTNKLLIQGGGLSVPGKSASLAAPEISLRAEYIIIRNDQTKG